MENNQIKSCPNCGKKMLYNYMSKKFECPKHKLDSRGTFMKYGCGYINQK